MQPGCGGQLWVPGGLRCVRVAQRERLSHHETRRAGRSLCSPNVFFSSSASPYVHSEDRCYRRMCRQWWSDRKLSLSRGLGPALCRPRGQRPWTGRTILYRLSRLGRLVLRTRVETVVQCHLSHHLPGAIPIVVTRAFHVGLSPVRHALVLPDVIRHPAATRLNAGESRHDGRDRAAACYLLVSGICVGDTRCPRRKMGRYVR